MQRALAAEVFRAVPPSSRVWLDAALIIGGSIVVSLLAQMAIPLPFTPVPLTGQTLGVLLVGGVLGANRGALSMLLYLGEGVAGLPVFANGGFGPAWLLGPTGGYLIGFVAAAWIVGSFADRGLLSKWKTSFAAFLVGMVAIFFVGIAWLGTLIGWEKAIVAGLVPFIPGALIKTALAASLLPVASRWVRKAR